MRTLLCPRCGEWMDESHPDFPRCVYCGELLIRCGWCRAFPGEGQPCPRAKGHPVVYATTVWNCPSFVPRYLVRRTSFLASPQARWQVAASFLFTISVLVVAFFSRPSPPHLLVAATAPSQVTVGDTMEVRLLVQSGHLPIRLRLDRRLLADFQLVGIHPLPSKVTAMGAFYEFILPSLRNPQPITLQFKSTKAGEYAMRAMVLTSPHQKAEWQTKVKVVQQAPALRPPQGLAVAMARWR